MDGEGKTKTVKKRGSFCQARCGSDVCLGLASLRKDQDSGWGLGLPSLTLPSSASNPLSSLKHRKYFLGVTASCSLDALEPMSK